MHTSGRRMTCSGPGQRALEFQHKARDTFNKACSSRVPSGGRFSKPQGAWPELLFWANSEQDSLHCKR